MEFSENTESFDQRLSKQLHLFSEISEMITFRLLELEERLNAIENRNNSLENQTENKISHLLEDSEQRTMHLKGLLEKDEHLTEQDKDKKEQGIHAGCPPSSPLGEKGIEGEILSLVSENQPQVDDQNSFVTSSDQFEENREEFIDDPEMPLMSA